MYTPSHIAFTQDTSTSIMARNTCFSTSLRAAAILTMVSHKLLSKFGSYRYLTHSIPDDVMMWINGGQLFSVVCRQAREIYQLRGDYVRSWLLFLPRPVNGTW